MTIGRQGGTRKGAGRPHGATAASTELRDSARKHTDEALAVIIEVMQTKDHPHRLRAAEMLLLRGHGAPRDVSPASSIIERFVNGEITAITAALQIESEGLVVSPTMQKYLSNEWARAQHAHSFAEQVSGKPPLLSKS